jgi:hypothetical protein
VRLCGICDWPPQFCGQTRQAGNRQAYVLQADAYGRIICMHAPNSEPTVPKSSRKGGMRAYRFISHHHRQAPTFFPENCARYTQERDLASHRYLVPWSRITNLNVVYARVFVSGVAMHLPSSLYGEGPPTFSICPRYSSIRSFDQDLRVNCTIFKFSPPLHINFLMGYLRNNALSHRKDHIAHWNVCSAIS